MPAEWEPHAATWLQWPRAEGASFPGSRTARIEPVFVDLIEIISKHETVDLAVHDEEEGQRIRRLLSDAAAKRSRFHCIPTREPWCRDIGPTLVREGPVTEVSEVESVSANEIVAIKWTYNGWGEQWPYELDDRAGHLIAGKAADRVDEAEIVFEGGGVESNGEGCLMVTEECLLDPRRNPDMTREQAEAVLRRHLGAERIVWLRGGVDGDDTGHIDVVARFVGRNSVVVPWASEQSNPDFATFVHNRELLVEAEFDVVDVPALKSGWNNVFKNTTPKSYVNFYVMNGCVLVPSFKAREDDVVYATMARLFPDREVVMFDSRELVFGRGGIHCLTQQVPRRV